MIVFTWELWTPEGFCQQEGGSRDERQEGRERQVWEVPADTLQFLYWALT